MNKEIDDKQYKCKVSGGIRQTVIRGFKEDLAEQVDWCSM